jgi:HEAT repeat protein
MDNKKALKKISARTEGERKRATYHLISNGGSDELAVLKPMLNESRPSVRENAAIAIGAISRRIDDSSSVAVLLKRYEIETDGLCKEAIVGALCDIGDVSALSIYEKYIEREHNEKLRFRIAETLAEIASEKSAPVLVKIIQGNNTDTLKEASQRALEIIAKKAGTTAEKLITKHSS